MFSSVFSAGLCGMDAFLVAVETDVSDGLPSFIMGGYLSAKVREAQDRVKTALRNTGFRIPPKKITINLSPADVRKEGTGFDLPIAITILAGMGKIPYPLSQKAIFIGELGLDGEIKPVRGILPLVALASQMNFDCCYLSIHNQTEGEHVEGISVCGVKNLLELVTYLQKPDVSAFQKRKVKIEPCLDRDNDFSQVNGQKLMKRATEVAVAGHHHILYIGPPGSGKTMIAKRIGSIMPLMTEKEQLEISQIYSICGLLSEKYPLLQQRPFRKPHQTITPQAFFGGGRFPRPGELSLASKGVLFLDELPEFSRTILEQLRLPLEEERITISRDQGACQFPADCLLAAAMNPCHCGFYPDQSRCCCTNRQVSRYLNQVSRPLLDRLDICVESTLIPYHELFYQGDNETSETVRRRVIKAVDIQKKRFYGLGYDQNAKMTAKDIKRFCRLSHTDETMLEQVFQTLKLSARAYHKVLKIARTIADLDGSSQISRSHLMESISYRSCAERYWEGQTYDKNNW